MGYMRHHAVLVTSWDSPVIELAHEVATKLVDRYDVHPCIVSPVTEQATNGYRSFAVFPDGSKEGWKASDQGDGYRQALVEYLDSQRHGDGSSNLDWCLVQYGDDNHDNRVLRHESTVTPVAEAGA